MTGFRDNRHRKYLSCSKLELYISQLMTKSCLECRNDKNLQPIHIIVLQILSFVILNLV